MKHIQNKNDWYYEFRPVVLIFIGFFGLLNRINVESNPYLIHFSHVCGALLLVASYFIMKWRKEYRKSLF